MVVKDDLLLKLFILVLGSLLRVGLLSILRRFINPIILLPSAIILLRGLLVRIRVNFRNRIGLPVVVVEHVLIRLLSVISAKLVLHLQFKN